MGTMILADGGLAMVGTLAVAGGFIVLGVIVLAAMGGLRAGGAQRRRLQALVPIDELLDSLDSSLLHADEAVRAAEQEQMFADAEFGAATSEGLTPALTQARASLDAAFARRRALDDLRAEGQEVAVRRQVQEITESVTSSMQTLRTASTGLGALRDDARHAPERLTRARTLASSLEERLPGAERTVAEILSARGAGAAGSLGPGLPEAKRLVDEAQGRLGGIGADSSMLSGEQLSALSAAEHALADAQRIITAAEGLDGELDRARGALPAAVGELRDSLARARATSDADPRLPQAIAVAQNAVSRAEDPALADPVSALAAVSRARGELDAAVEGARERFDARQRQEQQQVRTGRAQLPTLSDSYDPRVGERAAQAAELRWGPAEGSMPVGIAGDLPPAGAPRRDSSDLITSVLSEMARTTRRQDRRRRRF